MLFGKSKKDKEKAPKGKAVKASTPSEYTFPHSPSFQGFRKVYLYSKGDDIQKNIRQLGEKNPEHRKDPAQPPLAFNLDDSKVTFKLSQRMGANEVIVLIDGLNMGNILESGSEEISLYNLLQQNGIDGVHFEFKPYFDVGYMEIYDLKAAKELGKPGKYGYVPQLFVHIV